MEKDFAQDYAASFTLEPSSTALTIIDMQYATACRTTGLGKNMKEQGKEDVVVYRFDRIENMLLPNITKLLEFFRKNKLSVIYITIGSELPDYSDILPRRRRFIMSANNTKGNMEHEILDELKPLPNECVVNKLTAGAFNSSNIDSVLRAKGIKYILYTGVSTNVCVETTARDAADRGYYGIMVEDACGATIETLHNTALMNFRRSFGRVEMTEDVIAELSTALSK